MKRKNKSIRQNNQQQALVAKNGLPAVQTCKPTETFGTSWNEKNATKKAEICWAAESSISLESEHFLLSKTAAIVLFSVYRQLKEKMMQYSGKYIHVPIFFRCGACNEIKIRQRSKRNSNVSLSTFGNLSL